MQVFLPTFNLESRLWRPPAAPPAAPTSTLMCQLYLPSRALLDITPGNFDAWQPPVYYRVPPFSDVRPDDVVEVPALSGRLYTIRFVEDAHKGFPNEYRVGVLEQTFQPFPLP